MDLEVEQEEKEEDEEPVEKESEPEEPVQPVEEDDGKGLTGAAKTLCIPFAQPPMPENQLCFTSVEGSPGYNKKATSWALWGRSY